MTNQSRTTRPTTNRIRQPISHRVVLAVADRAGVQTDDLPPLYGTIDPDALNSMVEHDGANLTVSFSFAGYDVVIDGERICVEQDS